ncbi:MAG: hypothetical protein HW416_742 [Chloroflexi bacterium]|nr:hypothetical protein [Chloroflexota bacterium]
MSPQPGEAVGRVAVPTRIYLAIVACVGLVTGVVLLKAPDTTADYFAWQIDPANTAIFMGAGYLGTGVTLVWGVVNGLGWTGARLIVRPVMVFASIMIVATLMHADRFRWERAVTWMWLSAYALVIVGALVVEVLERRRAPLIQGAMLPPSERTALLVVGVTTGAVALFLFAAPQIAATVWPWALTPLTSRILAGWTAVAATLALVAARSGDSESLSLPLVGWLVTVGLFLEASALSWNGPGLMDVRTLTYFAALAGSMMGAIWLGLRVFRRTW